VILSIHPETPQRRHLERVAELLRKDGVIADPTNPLLGPGWRAGVAGLLGCEGFSHSDSGAYGQLHGLHHGLPSPDGHGDHPHARHHGRMAGG